MPSAPHATVIDDSRAGRYAEQACRFVRWNTYTNECWLMASCAESNDDANYRHIEMAKTGWCGEHKDPYGPSYLRNSVGGYPACVAECDADPQCKFIRWYGQWGCDLMASCVQTNKDANWC